MGRLMASFVNIAADGQPEILVNAADLSVIIADDENLSFRFANSRITFKTEEVLSMLAPDYADRIAAALGTPLAELPCKQNRAQWTLLVNPSALAYLTVDGEASDVNPDIPASWQSYAIGISGYGTLQSQEIPVRDINAFLITIQSALRKPLLPIEPQNAYSDCFHGQGYTVINPDNVALVCSESAGVRVSFRKTQDLRLVKTLPDYEEYCTQIAEQNPQMEFEEVAERVYDEKPALDAAACTALAQSIAAATRGRLAAAFEGSIVSLYADPDTIETLRISKGDKKTVSIAFNSASVTADSAQTDISFADEAAATQCLRAFTQRKTAPAHS